MVATTNHKYANSSSNYYVMRIQILKKTQNRKISKIFAFRVTKCQFEVNNNHEAVVVCARRVVK